jgi:hypothetical protein
MDCYNRNWAKKNKKNKALKHFVDEI